MKQDDLLTVEELAKFLRVSRNTAYKLLRAKQIPATKVGRSWLCWRSDVIEYLERSMNDERAE